MLQLELMTVTSSLSTSPELHKWARARARELGRPSCSRSSLSHSCFLHLVHSSSLFSTLSHPSPLLLYLCHLFHHFCGHIVIFRVWYHNGLDYMDYRLYLEGNSSHSAVSGQMAEGLCSPRQMFPCLICTCFHMAAQNGLILAN